MTPTPTPSSPAAEAAPSHRVDRDPTLSVSYLDGRIETLGIADVLRDAHLIADLAGLTPPGYAMWRRVLTVFAYRVTGLDAPLDVDAWRQRRDDLWRAGTFDSDAIDTYCETWAHRLDLFDAERPWLQVAALRQEADRKPVSVILSERPSGENSATVFSPYHAGIDRPVDVPRAIEAMLSLYGYGAGGMVGNRALGGDKPRKTGFSGPLRAKVSHLPLGHSLFRSLLASLVAPISVPSFAATNGPDLAPWETEEAPADQPCPAPVGVISTLTGQFQRAILLDPDATPGAVAGARSTWRYVAKGEHPDGSDPFCAYQTKIEKDGPRQVAKYSPLDAEPTDAWRSLPAILPAAGATTTHATPAALRETETILGGRCESPMRVAVCSWFQEPGQARDGDWLRSDTPDIHVALWTIPEVGTSSPDTWRNGIAAWVEAIEAGARDLAIALTLARAQAFDLDLKKQASNAKAWANDALPTYWQRASLLFRHAQTDPHMSGDVFEQRSQDAPAAVARLVVDLYDEFTEHLYNARTAKALASNRPRARREHVAEPS